MELCRREEGVSVASFYFNSDCKQSEAYRTTEHATFPGIVRERVSQEYSMKRSSNLG